MIKPKMQTGNGLRQSLRSALGAFKGDDAQTSSKVAPIHIVSIPSYNHRGRTNVDAKSATRKVSTTQKNETSLKLNQVTPARFVNPFASLRQSALGRSAAKKGGTVKNRKNSLTKKEIADAPKDKKKPLVKKRKVTVGENDKKMKKRLKNVKK